MNECTGDAQGMTTLAEKLVVRRGNCDPVTVMTMPAVGPVADLLPEGAHGCQTYGRIRVGRLSASIGRFQRIGALADESGIVFEVTDRYSLVPWLTPPPPEEGIYFVDAHGKGLRRLGPPVGHGFLTIVPGTFGPLPFTIVQTDTAIFASSPDGRRIAFTASVADQSGVAVRQVFLLDVASGTRTQVTHLPRPAPGAKDTCCPLFANDRTLVFFDGVTGSLATVSTDGTGVPKPIPALEGVPGATVIPQLGIVSGRGNAYPIGIPGELVRRYGPSDRRLELFLLQGKRALQLTDFSYPDTGWEATLGRGHVIFIASADPTGANPAGMCQLFSVPALAGRFRQITHFPDDGLEKQGCGTVTGFGASCRVNNVFEDLPTRTVLFLSSCDPLGRTRIAEQYFTMRPDGSALRQVTDFAGLETLPDGSVRVEMGGPFATSAARR